MLRALILPIQLTKKDFIALKAEVYKLGINELINVSTSLNNLKRKEDALDAGKFKAVHIDFKAFSDVVDNKVFKNTKVNNLEKKIPEATTLIHVN